MAALTVYDDVAAFLPDVREHLELHEAQNGMLLGLLGQLADNPPAAPSFLARVHEVGETLGVAYLNGSVMFVSEGSHWGADALVEALRTRSLPLPGIAGPHDDVELLAAAWTHATGRQPRSAIEQMLYELRVIAWPAAVPGRMRPMTPDDVEVVMPMVYGFHHDAMPLEPYSEEAARKNALARPALGLTYLWEVEGAPVAMAALTRPTRRGISVNAVYTPPEQRGRGYASALVAAVSQEGLKRGKEFCALYADRANPTASAIYQRLGYQAVSRAMVIRFET